MPKLGVGTQVGAGKGDDNVGPCSHGKKNIVANNRGSSGVIGHWKQTVLPVSDVQVGGTKTDTCRSELLRELKEAGSW